MPTTPDQTVLAAYLAVKAGDAKTLLALMTSDAAAAYCNRLRTDRRDIVEMRVLARLVDQDPPAHLEETDEKLVSKVLGYLSARERSRLPEFDEVRYPRDGLAQLTYRLLQTGKRHQPLKRQLPAEFISGGKDRMFPDRSGLAHHPSDLRSDTVTWIRGGAQVLSGGVDGGSERSW